MARVLRPLALANAAVAVAFALPLLVWVAADYFSRGSLQVNLPAAESTDQTLARIQATTNIEDLRRQANVLAEMRGLDRQHREFQGRIVDQMYRWVWVFMGIVSAAFLANAALLFWAHVREKRAL